MVQPNAEQQDVVVRFNELEDRGQQFQTLEATKSLIPESDVGKTRIWMALFVLLGIALVILVIGAVILLVNDKQTGGALLLAPASAIRFAFHSSSSPDALNDRSRGHVAHGHDSAQ